MSKCAKCQGSGWITKAGHSKQCDVCSGSGKTLAAVSSKATIASTGVHAPAAK